MSLVTHFLCQYLWYSQLLPLCNATQICSITKHVNHPHFSQHILQRVGRLDGKLGNKYLISPVKKMYIVVIVRETHWPNVKKKKKQTYNMIKFIWPGFHPFEPFRYMTWANDSLQCCHVSRQHEKHGVRAVEGKVQNWSVDRLIIIDVKVAFLVHHLDWNLWRIRHVTSNKIVCTTRLKHKMEPLTLVFSFTSNVSSLVNRGWNGFSHFPVNRE